MTVDKKEKAKNDRRYNTYGLEPYTYICMLAGQDFSCAICKVHERSTRLCVDHIHVAGFKKMLPTEKKKYVRGLLCFLCNTAIKGFDKTKDGVKNRQRLEGTYEYFKKYSVKGEI